MSLSEWYGNREILLTGVTSQLGRNLLEKLLRSFPNIKVHLVLRTREGLSQIERVRKKIFASPGYERLRQLEPEAFSRIAAYEGNLVYDELGCRPSDHRAMANVSVVFHVAGPSKCLLGYCRELPNLQAVVVVGDLFSCKEDQVLERVMEEDLPSDLPLGFVRLPAVGPAHREPLPGFVELMKGPTAFMVGAGHVLGRSDLPAEIIPVDYATNTLIAAAWDIHRRGKVVDPVVYNACTLDCKWGDIISKGDRASRNFRYPTFRLRGISSSLVLHWIIVFLFEWLPSFFCDRILGLFRRKKRLLDEYHRVRKMLKSFEPMLLRTLTVERRKINLMLKLFSEADKEAFPLRVEIDIEAYLLCVAAATRKYCTDESNLKIVTFFLPAVVALVLLVCCYFFLQ